MHHVVLDRWSRRTSPLHRRDARVKVIAALAMLIVIATTHPVMLAWAAAFGLVLLVEILIARLPVVGLLVRACIVLPFTGTFAIITWLAGDPDRAVALAMKSYLSAVTVLVLAATTPLPQLLQGIESLGAPRMLVLVVQFMYRYLFVISEQGQHMRQAARCRGELSRKGGWFRLNRSRFQAAGGALAVLFAKSYQRAEAIHRSMISRGFSGHIRSLSHGALRAADFVFLAMAAGIPAAFRVLMETGFQ